MFGTECPRCHERIGNVYEHDKRCASRPDRLAAFFARIDDFLNGRPTA